MAKKKKEKQPYIDYVDKLDEYIERLEKYGANETKRKQIIYKMKLTTVRIRDAFSHASFLVSIVQKLKKDNKIDLEKMDLKELSRLSRSKKKGKSK